jgi:hypothetical protein
LVKKDRANTPILQPRIQAIWTHWLEQIRVFWNTGNVGLQAIRAKVITSDELLIIIIIIIQCWLNRFCLYSEIASLIITLSHVAREILKSSFTPLSRYRI